MKFFFHRDRVHVDKRAFAPFQGFISYSDPITILYPCHKDGIVLQIDENIVKIMITRLNFSYLVVDDK